MAISVIPVLDIKGGTAVHAVGGVRERYGPLNTILCEGARPVDIARAYRDRLGLRTLYLADLDAIGGKPPDFDLYRSLAEGGVDLWLDAGLRDASFVEELLRIRGITLIVGLETISGPAEAREILEVASVDRAVFSLDQSGGRPLTRLPNLWGAETPHEIAESILALGYERLILLDLVRVGTGRGPASLDLLGHLARRPDPPRVYVGGGIAGIEDVRALGTAGASGVLVGSAFHDGRIGVHELFA